MEKILSKALLLQNVHSTDSFVAEYCLKEVFEELLKGRQGLVSMQDLIFSPQGLTAKEFFKKFGIYFLEKEAKNMQDWDNFFNILEDRPEYMENFRQMVLKMYLHQNISREAKRRCYLWLNYRCQYGDHNNFILKLLSHPEDGKLLLLANKYCCQSIYPSQAVLEAVCSLSIRVSRKLDAYSFFLKFNDKEFDTVILKNLLKEITSPAGNITWAEKKQIWAMIVKLLPRTDLVECQIDINLFSDLFQKNRIDSATYLDVLDAYAKQKSVAKNISAMLNGYAHVVVFKQQKEYLSRVNSVVFALMDSKPEYCEEALALLLDIAYHWKDENWFKFEYLSNIKANIYRHLLSVKEVNISVLSRSIAIDDNLFLSLVNKVNKKEIKPLVEMVALKYPQMWTSVWSRLTSLPNLNLDELLSTLAALYKQSINEQISQNILASLQMVLYNLPAKENVASELKTKFAYLQDGGKLQAISDSYLANSEKSIVNHMVG